MTAIVVADLDWETHPDYGIPRDEWLDLRRNGIGGSDAAAIAGLDRFRSPLTIYFDKLGELEPSETSDAMHFGHKLEPVVADEFADRNPALIVTRPVALHRSAEYPFMFSNVDRELSGLTDAGDLVDIGGLEIKTTALVDEWREYPPVRVQIQCHHYMIVRGWSRMAVAVLVNGRNYEQWILERDDELVGMLVELEAEFWQRVESRQPPPTDGHRSTTETLGQIYRRAAEGSTIDLGPVGAELCAELAIAQRALRDAKADVGAIENGVKALLGENEVGLLDGEPVVTWKAPRGGGRKHNCPDCVHAGGAPSRRFNLKGDK